MWLTNEVHAHTVAPVVAVELESVEPKLIPAIVIDAPDEGALYAVTPVIVGASYENVDSVVPTSEAMTRCPLRPCETPWAVAALTDEYVVHVTVPTCVSPNPTVGVMSLPPKLMPTIVATEEPEEGEFAGSICERTGASYEK